MAHDSRGFLVIGGCGFGPATCGIEVRNCNNSGKRILPISTPYEISATARYSQKQLDCYHYRDHEMVAGILARRSPTSVLRWFTSNGEHALLEVMMFLHLGQLDSCVVEIVTKRFNHLPQIQIAYSHLQLSHLEHETDERNKAHDERRDANGYAEDVI